MQRRRNAALGAAVGLVAIAALPRPSWGIVSSNSSLDMAQVIGANTFYANGYTGSRAIIADVEAGLIWNGQESLGKVTTQFADTSITDVSGWQTAQVDRHATWVGQLMAGNAGTGSTTMQLGIAYNATLWSGSIATDWTGLYSFDLTPASFTGAYFDALIGGVNSSGTADVIDSPWTNGDSTNGNDYYTKSLDSMIYRSGKIVVFSAGNGGAANTVASPQSGMNVITVGGVGSDTSNPVYGTVSSFSSRSPGDFFLPTNAAGTSGTNLSQVRQDVDLTAPAEDLTLAYYGGATGGNTGGSSDLSTNEYSTNLAGTSFSAPMVSAGAALLVDVGKANYDAQAIDGRVIKAVLMNSAAKPAGWTNNSTMIGGVYTTSQGVDNSYGAGILNLTAAYPQYTAGNTDLPGLSGGAIKPIGWDYGSIAHGAGTATQTYSFSDKLKGGTNLTATVAWFADETTNADGTNPMYGSFDNLDLELLENISNVWTPVALSDSLYNSFEHLYYTLPSDGYYELEVLENGYTFNFNGDTATPYGLAWSATAVPEPATGGLALAALIPLLGRRRRRAPQRVDG